jgi:P27 family predicted phage terminase small subunit
MRGRKPRSTARRRLEGNPSGRPFNEREPKPPSPTEDFDAVPGELLGHAAGATEWRRLAGTLRQTGQISVVDRSVLIAVCLEWDRYLVATSEVQKRGLVIKTKNGYSTPNPFGVIARQALAACIRLWSELGLSPTSRVRLSTTPLVPDADVFSEFDVAPRVHKPQ